MSDYPNSGILFPNQQKKKDSHPDYTGNAEVAGKKYELAGWKKTGKKGNFLTISFSEPRQAKNDDDSF